MNWKTEKRKLCDLIEYEKNPRRITEKQKCDLQKSLDKFGLVEIPVINLDNKIIAGHQRIKILSLTKPPEYEIDVRVPEKKLTEEEFKEYLIRSNKNVASWDWNILEEFDGGNLIAWGFDDFEIKVDKLNIDTCFSEIDNKKKKVRVKNCEFCGNGVNIELMFLIKTFENYNFKDDSDLSKKIYEKIKEFEGEDKIYVIIKKKDNNEIILS